VKKGRKPSDYTRPMVEGEAKAGNGGVNFTNQRLGPVSDRKGVRCTLPLNIKSKKNLGEKAEIKETPNTGKKNW